VDAETGNEEGQSSPRKTGRETLAERSGDDASHSERPAVIPYRACGAKIAAADSPLVPKLQLGHAMFPEVLLRPASPRVPRPLHPARVHPGGGRGKLELPRPGRSQAGAWERGGNWSFPFGSKQSRVRLPPILFGRLGHSLHFAFPFSLSLTILYTPHDRAPKPRPRTGLPLFRLLHLAPLGRCLAMT